MRHTLLGAGGSIGIPLVNELLKANEQVRLVSRSGHTMQGAESHNADITSYEEVLNSVKDSDVVYLLAGLKYDIRVWREQWPKIMQNTIDACKRANAKLIFLDNNYSYGRVNGKMTEDTPYNPCSNKGEVRAKIAAQLENEYKQNNLDAIIARAADFYGPYATTNSVPFLMVFDRMLKGQKAQWMMNADKIHTFSYTLDCAKGLKILADKKESFNRTWHLPSFNPPINGKSFIRLVADELGMKADYSIMKKWMLNLAGLFNRTVNEVVEMLYQVESDYYFDSTSFNEYFNYQPISYKDGIHETVEFLKKAGIKK
jgi:nucleoside-diphosphate-sugar epimerase